MSTVSSMSKTPATVQTVSIIATLSELAQAGETGQLRSPLEHANGIQSVKEDSDVYSIPSSRRPNHMWKLARSRERSRGVGGSVSDGEMVVAAATNHRSRRKTPPWLHERTAHSSKKIHESFEPCKQQLERTIKGILPEVFDRQTPRETRLGATTIERPRAAPRGELLRMKANTPPKERRQTPEWIQQIFALAKQGNLEQLQLALWDMEATLVRNLSDHKGNNLLHIMCSFGHKDALAWLCSTCGGELESALHDENKVGLTPVAVAVKAAQLECLEWLVHHTGARERLVAHQGERSLLHYSAKYGKESVIRWLINEMAKHDIELDQRDFSGNTPLHLAAKAGQIGACRILLLNRADITLKNDMGFKAHDLATFAHHEYCADYLLLFQTASTMANELTSLEEQQRVLSKENVELKYHFREALQAGKWLTKAREETGRELTSFKQSLLELHDKLLVERHKTSYDRGNIEDAARLCWNLQEQWRNHTRQWFASDFADMEHKLLKADKVWKRIRNNVYISKGHPSDITSASMDMVRQRLSKEESKSVGLCYEVPSLSSSESSLDSAGSSAGDVWPDERVPSSKTGVESVRARPYGNNMYSNGAAYSKQSNNVVHRSLDALQDFFSGLERELSENRRKAESQCDVPNIAPPEEDVAQPDISGSNGSASVLEVIEPEETDNSSSSLQLSLAKKKPCPAMRVRVMTNAGKSAEEPCQQKRHDDADETGGVSSSSESGLIESATDMEDYTPSRSVTFVELQSGSVTTASLSPTALSTSTPKKKSFLQKFAWKARWAGKRKPKPDETSSTSGSEVLTPSDFRETYLSTRSTTDCDSISKRDSGDFPDVEESTRSAPPDVTETTNAAVESDQADCYAYKQAPAVTLQPPQPPPRTIPPSNGTCGPRTSARPRPGTIVLQAGSVSHKQPPVPLPPRRILSLSPSLLTPRRPHSSSSSCAQDTDDTRQVLLFRSLCGDSRPESALSLCKSGSVLFGASVSSTDLLPSADSITTGRISPAQSEVSKTESALAPPSHASDVSKTESARYAQSSAPAKTADVKVVQPEIEKNVAVDVTDGTKEEANPDLKGPVNTAHITLMPICKPLEVKMATVVGIGTERKGGSDADAQQQAIEENLDVPDVDQTSSPNAECQKTEKEAKPWYEVSDDESDLLIQNRLPARCSSSSNDDEPEYISSASPDERGNDSQQEK